MRRMEPTNGSQRQSQIHWELRWMSDKEKMTTKKKKCREFHANGNKAENECVNLFEFDVPLHRERFHLVPLWWCVFMCTTETSADFWPNSMLYTCRLEQRCNQKLQGILRVNFAFIYQRFKIFMCEWMCVCVCASVCTIHQFGYASSQV